MIGFDAFYRNSYAQLFRVLVSFTTDRQDAEDVLQEAYSEAASDWVRVSALDNPAAWVRRVAINRALDLQKRSRRRRRAYGRLPSAVVHLDQTSVEVHQALRALRPEDRQVIVLHHLLGLTVAEIAGEVGRPPGTVKSQHVRGRRELASTLRLSYEDAP